MSDTPGRSAFATWFEAQFGPPPSKQPWSDVEVHARSLERQAGVARELAERYWTYERQRDAALKAWCARETSDA